MRLLPIRLALIGSAAGIAVLAAGMSSSDAQFSRRYCTMGGGSQSSGEPDCSYNTWEQCVASASGLARYCSENPEWLWRQRGASQQEPRGKGRKGRDY
jgi:hypothetical protein